MPRKRAIGCESDGGGGGGCNTHSDDEDHDHDHDHEDDDVFEDPAAERERRRAKKLRRTERRRRKQKQEQKQQQQPTARDGSIPEFVDAAADSSSSSSRRSSSCRECLGASGHSTRSSSSSGDVHAEKESTSAGAATATSSRTSEAAAAVVPRGTFIIKDSQRRCSRAQAALDGKRGGGSPVSCGDGDGHGSMKKTAELTSGAEVAPAPAPALTGPVAQTLRCEGLAELSQVPNLLSDESIAGVVLAATAASAGTKVEEGTDDFCGVGVPEMTITGRRLNRKVGGIYIEYGGSCTVRYGMVWFTILSVIFMCVVQERSIVIEISGVLVARRRIGSPVIFFSLRLCSIRRRARSTMYVSLCGTLFLLCSSTHVYVELKIFTGGDFFFSSLPTGGCEEPFRGIRRRRGVHRRELGAAAPVAAGGRGLGGLALRRVPTTRAVGAVDVGCDFQPTAQRISGTARTYTAFRVGGVLSQCMERAGVILRPASLRCSLRFCTSKSAGGVRRGAWRTEGGPAVTSVSSRHLLFERSIVHMSLYSWLSIYTCLHERAEHKKVPRKCGKVKVVFTLVVHIFSTFYTTAILFPARARETAPISPLPYPILSVRTREKKN